MTPDELRVMLSETIVSGLLTKRELQDVIRSLGIKVTGVVGPYVLRYKNGKLIISHRPVHFQMSSSQKAENARRIHAASTKFAKYLYNIEPLKSTWEKAKLPGNNVFNKIIKYNKKNLIEGHPSVKNILCPDGSKINSESIVSWQNGKIRIMQDCNSNLVIVLVPFDPIDPSDSSFECIKIHCGPAAAGDIQFTNEQLSICRRYKQFVLYSVIINKKDNTLEWSATFTQQGKFEFTLAADYSEAEKSGYGQLLTHFLYNNELELQPHHIYDFKPK